MPMIARSSNDAAPTRFGLCVAATLALSTAAALPAQALQPAQHARVALITDHAAVAPGQSIHAGLRIAHDEGWHTYWVNSGDSGLATRFDWTMPAGATAGDIEWPAPERLPFGDLVNLGYKGDLVLPARLMVPADARPGARFEATLRARWLICADVCIPDEATLTLSLPVATAARPSEDAPRIAAALAQVPVEEPGWQGRTRRTAAGVEVEVHGCAAALGDAGRLEVYPKTAQVVANTRIDARHDGDGVLRFTHPASEFFAGMPETVEWVLVRHDGDVRRAFAVRLAGEDAMALAAPPAPVAPPARPMADPPQEEAPGLALALLFALAGGVILNLMPCVFPVLALKALSFARGAGHARRHAVLYAVGVVVSFLVLGGLLVALRGAGEAVGWGFQLQAPGFVAAMALLMAAVGFALSGLAAPGASLMGLGQSLTEGDGDRGAFFTGVLAVVVASPCTAPFMGPAIGVALGQPGPATIGIFAALGLGLALPMLALGLVPSLARHLPRPGPWMDRLKQALAFPMYAAALWLLWVLGRQVGVDGMALVLGGVVRMGFALWWRGPLPGRAKRLAVAALLLVALAPAAIVATLGPRASGAAASDATAPAGTAEPWSPERVEVLRAEGRPVLVNFTAAWCISCLANERIALSGAAFEAILRETGTAYLKADWTDADPRITAALDDFGRNGVPLYVVYPAGGGDPVVLPPLLAPGTVAEALRTAAARAPSRPNAATAATTPTEASR